MVRKLRNQVSISQKSENCAKNYGLFSISSFEIKIRFQRFRLKTLNLF